MASLEVSADELYRHVITFSPAWVFVLSPFEEEVELVVRFLDAVLDDFLDRIFRTVIHLVQLSRFRGERRSILRARRPLGLVRVYDLRRALAVDGEGAIPPLLYPVRAIGWGLQFSLILATIGRANKDVISWTDVNISAGHPVIEFLLVACLRFLQAGVGACDCFIESAEELMPVPAVRIRAIS